jgi:hypothetical protein
MQLRHISPRSSDWMDAMDEGAGGRGWERLAPEERVKLLRDRQESAAAPPLREPPDERASAQGAFELASPSR